MFDIGFGEMMVCAIVALVVIGPEKLPRVARTLGHLFGRLTQATQRVLRDGDVIINEIEGSYGSSGDHLLDFFENFRQRGNDGRE